MTFRAIDLSTLPPPDAVEALDYETLLAGLLAAYRAEYPEFSAVLESEPVMKLLELVAAEKLQLRQRVNDAVRANHVATAVGADLDNLAANVGVSRLTGEGDDALRRRVVLAPEGMAAAGPEGAYQFHALSADTAIKDVSVVSPSPGAVLVTVMSSAGDGRAPAEMVETVRAALSAEAVRPLTDMLSVRAPTIINYTVDAGLILYPGPDGETVRAAAQAAVTAVVARLHRLGQDVALSALYAALHQSGVQRVILRAPVSDVAVDVRSAAYCTAIKVVVDGRNQ